MNVRSTPRRWWGVSAAVATVLTLAACAPGSSTANSAPAPAAPAAPAASTAAAPSSAAGSADPGSSTGGSTADSPGGAGSSAGAPSSPAAADITTDPVTLTVWDQEVRGGQNEQMKTLNAAFSKKYPNVKINRVSQSFDDLATTLRLALTDNKAPDVVQANNGRNTMGAFVKANQLMPLNSYAEKYGWTKRFAPSVLQYSTYSEDAKTFGTGNIYGLPQVGEVVGVFYNKKKLTALGLKVPTTWQEFEAALAAAKKAGEIPIQLGNLDKWPAVHVFGPIQGQYVAADQIVDLGLGNAGASWDTPENTAAATQLADWVGKGYFNDGPNGTDYDAAWQALTKNKGVFLIGGSWLAADLSAAMKDNVGFFAPPPPSGKTVATTGGTGLPFAITSKSKNPDVAAAYIDFITNDAAMDVLAKTGNLPVNRTAELAPKSGVLSEVFSAFGEVTTKGALLPYLDYATPTMGETLGQSLQDLIGKQADPKQFLQQLEDDYAAFVGKN